MSSCPAALPRMHRADPPPSPRDPADIRVLAPEGVMDTAAAAVLAHRIAATDSGCCYVIVDLRGVRLLPVPAIRILQGAFDRLAKDGRRAGVVTTEPFAGFLERATSTTRTGLFSSLGDAVGDALETVADRRTHVLDGASWPMAPAPPHQGRRTPAHRALEPHPVDPGPT